MEGLTKLGNVYSERFTGMSFAGNVWDCSGLCPALKTMQGGGCEPMIIVTKKEDHEECTDDRIYRKGNGTASIKQSI